MFLSCGHGNSARAPLPGVGCAWCRWLGVVEVGDAAVAGHVTHPVRVPGTSGYSGTVVSLGGTPLPPMPLYPDVPGTPDRMRDMPGDGGVTDLDHP